MAKKSGSKSNGRVKLNNGKLDKVKKRYEQFKFDSLQMYMGYPYTLDCGEDYGKIEINSPTLGDIIVLGQERFYTALHPFVTNTTQYRLPLWESGKDWNTMSDFELFITFVCAHNLDTEALSLVFGSNIDWNTFMPYMEQIEGKKTYYLISEESNIKIDENIYQHMTQYLHHLLNIFPEEKITKDPILKEWWINDDISAKKAKELLEKKNGKKDEDYSIQPLISACVNHPGFKYKISELRELTIAQFCDSVHRLQIYESTTALIKGSYSGFMDSSKIPEESFNWMRVIN